MEKEYRIPIEITEENKDIIEGILYFKRKSEELELKLKELEKKSEENNNGN